MKWIKKRSVFIKEAKIRDRLLPSQIKAVIDNWAESYLDLEEVDPTEFIKQGKWKLSEADKIKVLDAFFMVDTQYILSEFEKLPSQFCELLLLSIDVNLLEREHIEILKNFDPNKPSMEQISVMLSPVFRRLSINETKGDKYMPKDDSGVPLVDEDGKYIRKDKKKGDPIFEKNLVNINGFLRSYNKCYSDFNTNLFDSSDLSNIKSLLDNGCDNNYEIDFNIFDKDIYLSIDHNASDILNMSISKFYDSCQNLYDGSYVSDLLSNVFDPSSIPAFLIFDTPIYHNGAIISKYLPLTRTILREIEGEVYFDSSYPGRMDDVMIRIVGKYSGNIEDEAHDPSYYKYSPDLPLDDDLNSPYMDRFNIKQIPRIGKNVSRLEINNEVNWKDIEISKEINIKELIISNNDLPDSLLSVIRVVDCIEMRSLDIKTLSLFNGIKTDKMILTRCKISNETFEGYKKEQIKTLVINNCELSNFSKCEFPNLEKIELLYTIDSFKEIDDIIENLDTLKVIVVSTDLYIEKGAKEYFKNLSKKYKIETEGIKIK